LLRERSLAGLSFICPEIQNLIIKSNGELTLELQPLQSFIAKGAVIAGAILLIK
jgi:hypothetical protein